MTALHHPSWKNFPFFLILLKAFAFERSHTSSPPLFSIASVAPHCYSLCQIQFFYYCSRETAYETHGDHTDSTQVTLARDDFGQYIFSNCEFLRTGDGRRHHGWQSVL